MSEKKLSAEECSAAGGPLEPSAKAPPTQGAKVLLLVIHSCVAFLLFAFYGKMALLAHSFTKSLHDQQAGLLAIAGGSMMEHVVWTADLCCFLFFIYRSTLELMERLGK